MVAAGFWVVRKLLDVARGRLRVGDLGGASCPLNVFLSLSRRYGRENECRVMGERESFLQGTSAPFEICVTCAELLSFT